MKKIAISITLCALLGTSFASHAALTPSADGKLIYDNDLNLTWIADADYAKNSGFSSTGIMNWYDATNNWADKLTAYDHSDWRLPTASEISHLYYQELGGSANLNIATNHNVYYDLFDNLHSDYYWTSTEVANNADKATAFTFSGGHAYTGYDKTTGLYAMAVHPGNIASAVPEPETYAMLLAGLGLLGWRMRNARS